MPQVSPFGMLRGAPRSIRLLLGGFGLCVVVALAGCGGAATASSGAAASATPTCPPAGNFKSVSGTISATGNGSISVTDATGAEIVVQLTSTTRISKQTSVAPTSIATGTNVLIVSDTNATTAQRIAVLSGAGGIGGGFGRFGGGTRTPGAARNAACFQRTPGAGRFGGGTGAFQGLRGTVASVSGSQIIVNDSQGQTFSLAITPATVITSTSAGSAADLLLGATVTAAGQVVGSQIKAVTISVQPAH